jgi:hypothetical protein
MLDEDRLFEDKAEGEQGRIKWKDSQAHQLFYMDILKENIPMDNETMTAEEIFIQRPEFAAYDIDKFHSKLTTVRKQIKERND